MRSKGSRSFLAIALVVGLAVAAWRFLSPGGPPSTRADIEAVIVAVEDRGRFLLVQSSQSADPDYRVRITNRTRVFRQGEDGRAVAVDAWSPAPGQGVQIWFDGPVLESFPAQAAAGTILLLD